MNTTLKERKNELRCEIKIATDHLKHNITDVDVADYFEEAKDYLLAKSTLSPARRVPEGNSIQAKSIFPFYIRIFFKAIPTLLKFLKKVF